MKPASTAAARPPGRRTTGESGFTMMELVGVAVVLMLVLGITVSSLLTGQRALGLGVATNEVEGGAQRMLQELLPELRQAGTAYDVDGDGSDDEAISITEGTSAQSVSFRKNTGYDAARPKGVVWSNRIRYAFQRDLTESLNGVDDDNDGLVDEGYVYRLEPVGGVGAKQVVLVPNVLAFTVARDLVGQEVTVTIKTAKRLTDGSVRVYEVTEKTVLRH